MGGIFVFALFCFVVVVVAFFFSLFFSVFSWQYSN